MKKFKYIICFFIISFSLFLSIGCTPNKNINLSFSDLQTIVLSTTPNTWNKLSATRTDSQGTETILINKTANISTPSHYSVVLQNEHDVKIDFVKENNKEKIYCKDNVRHHKGKDSKGRDRNYIDESEFDGQGFINETVSSYLEEMYNFFEQDNSNLLTFSNKTTNDNVSIIEFKAVIDKSENTTLKVELTTEDDILIKIKLEITSNNDTKEVFVEVFQTTEVVNSPEWFDNNDFKTPISYDQVKTIVLEENFTNWDSVELLLPVGYSSSTEIENVFASKSQNKAYILTDTTKTYFDGTYLYSYINNEPEAKENISENDSAKQKYTFDSLLTQYKNSAFGYFFVNELYYEEYFEGAKKYEKDITVVSYKYTGILENTKFESVCSLYYDTDNDLYQISCYAKQINTQDPQNEIVMFEINDLTLKKSNEFSIPNWFNESDFE